MVRAVALQSLMTASRKLFQDLCSRGENDEVVMLHRAKKAVAFILGGGGGGVGRGV